MYSAVEKMDGVPPRIGIPESKICCKSTSVGISFVTYWFESISSSKTEITLELDKHLRADNFFYFTYKYVTSKEFLFILIR